MSFRTVFLKFIFCFLLSKVAGQETEDVGYANDFVDEVLTNFRNTPEMVEKIDPVDIPDYKEGSIEIWDGVIKGLSSLHRYGNCILSYEEKVIGVTAEVAVRNVSLKLRYKAKLLFMTIRGKCEVAVRHMAVKAVLKIKNGKAELQTFEVVHLGKYDIKKITGMSKAFNWLVKLIANAVAKMSKKKIISALESGAAGAINEALAKVDLPFGDD